MEATDSYEVQACASPVVFVREHPRLHMCVLRGILVKECPRNLIRGRHKGKSLFLHCFPLTVFQTQYNTPEFSTENVLASERDVFWKKIKIPRAATNKHMRRKEN